MYLNEIEAYHKRMIDAWKLDAKGVLVFVSPKLLISVFVPMTSPKTGLFSALSATVGTFIIEFYKKLEPASDPNTADKVDKPSHPSASMIWVCAMWLVSLTSALVATLLQQRARRYCISKHPTSRTSQRPRACSRVFVPRQE
jgi:hypothetical protein